MPEDRHAPETGTDASERKATKFIPPGRLYGNESSPSGVVDGR